MRSTLVDMKSALAGLSCHRQSTVVLARSVSIPLGPQQRHLKSCETRSCYQSEASPCSEKCPKEISTKKNGTFAAFYYMPSRCAHLWSPVEKAERGKGAQWAL